MRECVPLYCGCQISTPVFIARLCARGVCVSVINLDGVSEHHKSLASVFYSGDELRVSVSARVMNTDVSVTAGIYVSLPRRGVFQIVFPLTFAASCHKSAAQVCHV